MMPPIFFSGRVCVLGLAVLLLAGCGQKATPPRTAAAATHEDEYVSLMNSGKNYLDKASATQAVAVYVKAVALMPTELEARLNLANAQLLADNAEAALLEARAAMGIDHNSAAAHFIAGCALNRLGQFLEAIKALQTSRDQDPTIAAVSFQLGMAQMQLKQYEEAIGSFQDVINLEAEHGAAHYQLSQALARSGREPESKRELETHQAIQAKSAGGPAPNVASYEKSAHTAARVPFKLEQPAKTGVKVAFSDQTQAFFGADAKNYAGPIGIIDVNHRCANDLFVFEMGQGFRLLINSNHVFQPLGEPEPGIEGNRYRKALVGDLQNDRFEDVVVLGEKGSHVFKFATNGVFMEMAPFTRLQGLAAIDGALVDLDFTGKLDLLAVTAVTNDVRLFRNLGNMLFRDITATSGIPANIKGAQQIVVDDFNGDDMMDAVVGGARLQLLKQRGGPLVSSSMNDWPADGVMVSGDLNNDLRIDTVIAAGGKIECAFSNGPEKRSLESGPVRILKLFDYDNDGWLDVVAVGAGLRVWRNLGREGFLETTAELGLRANTGGIAFIEAADFDADGDSDFVVGLESGGLKLLRNDGGNANQQLKVRLYGNRSNASGLGVKLEVQAGGLRTLRTAHSLPIEIGTGKYNKVETFTVRWFDLAVPSLDLKTEQDCLVLAELILPTGSCPYLYVWDGTKHRFVTDLLGAAPLGLPMAEGRYIEADPDEFVWIGDDANFQPRAGAYQMQITEELREVLYLDEAKLFVVDHPPGTEVVSTDKLMPGKPFPPSGLMTLGARKPLLAARTLEGADVTQALQEKDRVMVSPMTLHIPQRRGMAETHGVELDFGALAVDRPLALALTGWLRFGGGMANMAASHLPDLPFPFPGLEVERNGKWEPVKVTAGAPAGKTKTIVIDLAGRLGPGSRKLRITAGFEIHWDRIALFEKVGEANTRIQSFAPTQTDLHWRGFSEFEDLPWTQPLTPDYAKVYAEPKWRVAVSGWCTRYGAVDELVAKRDDTLVLINGGDELTLRFQADAIAAKETGLTRDFFLYTDGWDKDADFHVVTGTTVEPIPRHGFDDQAYGVLPARGGEPWAQKYNTRWVGPETIKRTAQKK